MGAFKAFKAFALQGTLKALKALNKLIKLSTRERAKAFKPRPLPHRRLPLST
jgi:hypothetical protein